MHYIHVCVYIYVYQKEQKIVLIFFKFINNIKCLGYKRKHKPSILEESHFIVQDPSAFVYLHLCYSFHKRIVIKQASDAAVIAQGHNVRSSMFYIFFNIFTFLKYFIVFPPSTESFLHKYLKTRYPHSTLIPVQFCTLENCLLFL